MGVAENKAAVQRMFDALNANDLDGVIDAATDDIVVHTAIPGIAPGREGFRDLISLYLSAFPEQHIDLHELVGEGDRVMARHTHYLTHGGDFAGMPPTGKKAVVDGLELYRLRDGRLAEMWHHDDFLGLMQQLGAIPTAG